MSIVYNQTFIFKGFLLTHNLLACVIIITVIITHIFIVSKIYNLIIIVHSFELFTSALADGFSLESEWQQVSSSLQDSS